MSDAAIAVEDLRVSYGGTEVLHGLRFEVPWGQVCGYLGPNGAGKSTTMRALIGLLRPSSGHVRLAGLDPAADDLDARRVLGYVPDGGGLYRLLSAREHLWLVADLHELPAARASARIDALAERLGFEALLDRRLDTLSKGERQRVALACGLVHEPRVLLLDEPLSGLDVHGVVAVRRTIRELVEGGGTVLYCSHVLDVVERVCDRALILDAGRVIADAPTAELVARASDHRLESVFRELTRSDADVRGALEAAG